MKMILDIKNPASWMETGSDNDERASAPLPRRSMQFQPGRFPDLRVNLLAAPSLVKRTLFRPDGVTFRLGSCDVLISTPPRFGSRSLPGRKIARFSYTSGVIAA